jgi:hypothetical protein
LFVLDADTDADTDADADADADDDDDDAVLGGRDRSLVRATRRMRWQYGAKRMTDKGDEPSLQVCVRREVSRPWAKMPRRPSKDGLLSALGQNELFALGRRYLDVKARMSVDRLRDVVAANAQPRRA